jgi:hypothetical protein
MQASQALAKHMYADPGAAEAGAEAAAPKGSDDDNVIDAEFEKK